MIHERSGRRKLENAGRLGHRSTGPVSERLVRGRGNGVFDHGERVAGVVQGGGHEGGAGHEGVGHDGDGGSPGVLDGDGVVQTARRTTASITDSGEHDRPLGGLGNEVGLGRG